MTNIVLLTICVGGIYASFLTWGFLQENLSSQRFGPSAEHFNAPFFITLVQSIAASIIGWLYLQFSQRGMKHNDKVSLWQWDVIRPIAIVALTQSLSSPVGLSSLQHVDYLLYQLAKSCKLIPVMLVSSLIYKRKFPLFKYAVALTVTAGVVLFTLANGKKKSPTASDDSSDDSSFYILGLVYLAASLFLDGLTNSTQDVLFRENKKLSGAHLMTALNFVSSILTLGYCLISGQLYYSIDFISKYPLVLKEVALYACCGAVGQIFIFVTLAEFGSMVLIMVTVTRKMVSMLLSVIVFGHQLTFGQWMALSLVFGGIGVEAVVKLKEDGKKKSEKKEK